LVRKLEPLGQARASELEQQALDQGKERLLLVLLQE
jgi:hypothetical protein